MSDAIRSQGSQQAEEIRPRSQRQLDELIDWYEKFKPAVNGVVRVNVRRRTARRYAKAAERGGPLFYRGRQLETKELWAPNEKDIEKKRESQQVSK